jgi:hypothetical protein
LNTTESGTSIWDKDLFTVLGLKTVDIIADNLLHYKLNEAFMAFGALGVAYNVVTRYIHNPVRATRRLTLSHAAMQMSTSTKRPPVAPSLCLSSGSYHSLFPAHSTSSGYLILHITTPLSSTAHFSCHFCPPGASNSRIRSA